MAEDSNFPQGRPASRTRESGHPRPVGSLPLPTRRIYCNRTLNLRGGISAIGFDMDYTLVHYDVEAWERRAFEHARERLLQQGFPVATLAFDPGYAMLGLIIDVERGNLVKANRFGFVKRAAHGTRMLEFDAQRTTYERVTVDLADRRWVFINTLFGHSEACLFAQLVDLLDRGDLDHKLGPGSKSYKDIYEIVRASLDATHMEGELKAEIVAAPEKYVDLDPEVPLALLDLRHSGKKLILVTNSEWTYTNAMMTYTMERYLNGASWRSLFDLVVVAARKPAFFTERMPAFEVLDNDGRLLPAAGKLRVGAAYLGGHARLVEQSLGIPGDQILYVGDHIFADVNISKSMNSWRTCLIVRELEREIDSLEMFKDKQRALSEMMDDKERLEHHFSLLRLAIQRREKGYALDTPLLPTTEPRPTEDLRAEMRELRAELVRLDERIAPLAKESSELCHPRWGLLLRAGNDKSHLARQIERHADIYTSRVANFAHSTPFVYSRSPRGSLPHDSGPGGGVT